MIDLLSSLPGAVAQGLIWGIMAVGVYITYKLLDIADLTVDGYTGDTVCAACGKVLAKGEVIKALGHDYKDGACTRCGDKQPGVNTGDNSTMTMWTMSAVMALAGAAVLVLRSRKEKYEG